VKNSFVIDISERINWTYRLPTEWWSTTN